jgi:hypothetical protein
MHSNKWTEFDVLWIASGIETKEGSCKDFEDGVDQQLQNIDIQVQTVEIYVSYSHEIDNTDDVLYQIHERNTVQELVPMYASQFPQCVSAS